MNSANETVFWVFIVFAGYPLGLITGGMFSWTNFSTSARGLIIAVLLLNCSAAMIIMSNSSLPLIGAALSFLLLGIFTRGVLSTSGK